MPQIPSLFSILAALSLLLCSQHSHAQNWYKGNLHTHSYWSDGDEFPEQIMDWYKSHGYHFVALSDHNTLAAGEKWIKIRPDSIYQKGFESYLAKYGSDWVVHKRDDKNIQVQLKTFEQYRPLFEEQERFLILPSEEITDQFEKRPLHLNATNIQELIPPQGGNNIVDVLQNNIDAVHQQREETGTPMIVHVNHPNFRYAISLQDMIQLKGERFFEVFNGHPSVHNLGDSLHMGTEKMWDLINIAYLRQGKPLIYGLATDDSHHYHTTNRKYSNAGRGWIEVRADTLNAPALIEAMEQGQFYASTGIRLRDIQLRKNKLKVKVRKTRGARYTISFIGCGINDINTRVLKKRTGCSAGFKVTDDLLFVRAVITSNKKPTNPVDPEVFETAWVQPVQYKK